jgi:hypothetical protein
MKRDEMRWSCSEFDSAFVALLEGVHLCQQLATLVDSLSLPTGCQNRDGRNRIFNKTSKEKPSPVI